MELATPDFWLLKRASLRLHSSIILRLVRFKLVVSGRIQRIGRVEDSIGRGSRPFFVVHGHSAASDGGAQFAAD